MFNKKVLWWVVGIMVIAIFGRFIWIYQLNEFENLPEGMPTSFSKQWLNGISCSPPCWEGITPGVTTADEAVEIMNQNSAIIQGSSSLAEYGNTGFVTWEWLGTDLGGDALYVVDDPKKIIYQVRPQFDYIPGANPTFTLQEVINSYGDPSHISAYGLYGIEGQGPFYVVKFYWEELGISIEQGKINRIKPKISPSIKFSHVYFHSLPFKPDKYSVVWQGYKAFNDYCIGKPRGFWNNKCIIFP